ncbi:MAG: hypothetical protein ABR499_15880 [Gemmatimonadaceae bacterium]
MSLQQIGSRLRDDIGHLVERLSVRLASDPGMAAARGLTRTELEDHLVTFLSDLFLVVMACGEGERARRQAMRDSAEIQRIIAELHGRQRRRFGWTVDQVEREYAMLHAEIQALVRRRGADDPVACVAAAGLLMRLVAQARRCSRHGYRLAAAGPTGAADRTTGVDLRP